MLSEIARPEIINPATLSAIGLLAVGALSYAQRMAIKFDRDGGRCQATWDHKCDMKNPRFKPRLEAHHLVPQTWAENRLKEPEEVRDDPLRMITLCRIAHWMIHPDMWETTQGAFTPQFKKVRERRDKAIERGEKYWCTVYDHELTERAKQLTENAYKRGWRYPRKGESCGKRR